MSLWTQALRSSLTSCVVKQSQSIASKQSYHDKDLPIVTMGTVSITVIMLIACCPRFSTIVL